VKLLNLIIGGRPMRCIIKDYFMDTVAGKRVGVYEDKFGRQWMAEGPWNLFRVPISKPVDVQAHMWWSNARRTKGRD